MNPLIKLELEKYVKIEDGQIVFLYDSRLEQSRRRNDMANPNRRKQKRAPVKAEHTEARRQSHLKRWQKIREERAKLLARDDTDVTPN